MHLHWRSLLTHFLFYARSLLIPILIFHGMEFIVLIMFTIFEEGPINRCYIDGVPPFEMNAANFNPAIDPTSLEDIILSDVKPPPGRAIFFPEIRCHPGDVHRILQLTARQACAIESAALHNPHFQVFVLFESPTHMPVGETFPLLDAIRSYRNVHFRQLNIWSFAEGTPIEDWAKKAELLHSSFQSEYASDLLRFLTLYHFGGIYLSMDSIVLRSLENLTLNYVGAHDNQSLGNAVFSLKPRGSGHEFAKLFLREFQKSYHAKSNEQTLINRTMQKICGTLSIKEMQKDAHRCHGFKVFKPNTFFAVSDESNVFEEAKYSYIIHQWSADSNKCQLKADFRNTFAQFAKKYCPRVYKVNREYF
ncbi:lactosylceramide 4-alpha-galactosyltransferase-like [Drosophila albomicans]|uniref:Lactosylceramide 4-alpha-galactosyltransferase-like n=1 Tax=Drosophila albomicans TaxID=7291 RepID=A0A6P8WJB1_DROAB|nr:lactosylceramide 4-alpha-galactosyltransferase-like [Drosophila albomicans]